MLDFAHNKMSELLKPKHRPFYLKMGRICKNDAEYKKMKRENCV